MRAIHEIAAEVTQDWERPYFGAVPYLRAMHELESLGDYYGDDSGRTVVSYFLANATRWKGEAARRVKAELREMIK